MFLLCELNDENYTQPHFSFYEKFSEAENSAIDSIIEDFRFEEGYCIKIDNNEENDNTRITSSYISEDNMVESPRFYITNIFPIEESKGTHLLVWHHAYEGVDFEIRFQGTYEQCLIEKEKQMKTVLDCPYVEENGCNENFNIKKESVIDTGNEWEMWSIIEIEK